MSRLKHELMLLLSNSIHSIVPVKDVYDSLDSDSKHGDISYPLLRCGEADAPEA